MHTLYVIGNGFDLHHGLKTRYQHFGVFLKGRKSEIYDYLLEYYGLPDIDEEDEDSQLDPLWSEFEQSLANLDVEQVLDNNSHLIANPSSDEFRDRDWHALAIEMEMLVEKLTVDLIKEFNRFILHVEYPELDERKRLLLSEEAIYLNFNYTDCLERYYKIRDKNILYIHNKANKLSEKIILGHGFNPIIFKEKEESPPKDASEDELENWYEYMSNKHDYSFSSGKDKLVEYFEASFKKTDKVIQNNEIFFKRLCKVKNVIVLGHSLSVVDRPYFIKILDCVDASAKWTVTYYGDKEKKRHIRSLNEIGIEANAVELVEISRFVASVAS
ncbi:bacteriophage abortive infection AbiH family protein [Janthinobacterium sp. B9-8]|uniref:bacteriophage abortive infection AbiH family protein n=1 Tax=Janthinobacterium sp. B9-8 TaxID=1236179 RepID=UPI00061CE948|nr:bacteriophage abortive infection AbiH family protein [Janthinobacterium sp. B9-8]AMC35357.1 hypothetical protein VN23_12420 [Janthinobacterium sp. B9-8]